jgi:plasmid stability protein
MPQLTVRGVDEDLVRRLRVRAAQHGRSGEEEHRRILEAALRPERADFWEKAARLRAELAGRGADIDSAELIREERDRRAGLIP